MFLLIFSAWLIFGTNPAMGINELETSLSMYRI